MLGLCALLESVVSPKLLKKNESYFRKSIKGLVII